MPTNVGPEYKAAEERFRRAATPEEQLAALQEMLSTVPKHKGTEKLQGDIKRRISLLRRDTQRRRRGGQRPFYLVDRAEGGQAVLVGPPNAGKSRLLARLTSATPEVADYPYTTRVPSPGMMPYEDVMLQLVDLPPVAREGAEPWLFDLIRRADVVLLVVDVSDDDVLTQTEEVLELLATNRINLAGQEQGDAPPEEGEDELEAIVFPPKRTLVVANKVDSPRAEENLALLREWIGDRLPVLGVSAASGRNLERLREAIFEVMAVIRVYTKAPGEAAVRTTPFLLPRGSTVLDAARSVHADFARRLKFARIWGDDRFEGQMVARDDPLHDGDLVEFRI